MTDPATLALFAILDVAWTLAAGYLLAMENVVAGTRERFENWAYRDGEAVRTNEAAYEVDQFWDRAQPWALGRKPPKVAQPAVTVMSSTVPVTVTSVERGPAKVGRWLYRGKIGMALDGVKGRKVPTRLAAPGGRIRYAVPTLDGRPLNKLDVVATVLRTKAADLWGCPKCSGMWGGAFVSLAVSHYGPWGYGWPLVLGLHVAAWGATRRVGWGA